MNLTYFILWGGSRSRKFCVFPYEVAAAGDERYLLCAAGAGAIALEWLHENYIGFKLGKQPCIFSYKVAAAGDERYLLCAVGPAAIIWFLVL